MTTSATQDTSLQALLTVSHSLSLANDCPNIFLSLLKDNATSRNPALPSGQKQCNVLHSSPASGFPFSFSFLLYFSRRNSVYFSTSLHKLKSQQLTTQLHTAKSYVSKPMQHMQPSFPVQVISEPMQHMQPSPVRDVHSPWVSQHFKQVHVTSLTNCNCLLLTHRATHSLHYQWLSHWVVHKTCFLKSLYIKLGFVAGWEVVLLSLVR